MAKPANMLQQSPAFTRTSQFGTRTCEMMLKLLLRKHRWVSNFTQHLQQHAKTCNRVCKRTQRDIQQRWELLANNVASDCTGLTMYKMPDKPLGEKLNNPVNSLRIKNRWCQILSEIQQLLMQLYLDQCSLPLASLAEFHLLIYRENIMETWATSTLIRKFSISHIQNTNHLPSTRNQRIRSPTRTRT